MVRHLFLILILSLGLASGALAKQGALDGLAITSKGGESQHLLMPQLDTQAFDTDDVKQ